MKKLFLVMLWSAVISFLIMNFSWNLAIGLIIGIVGRVVSGKIISIVLGIVIGIVSVELAKFITYKVL